MRLPHLLLFSLLLCPAFARAEGGIVVSCARADELADTANYLLSVLKPGARVGPLRGLTDREQLGLLGVELDQPVRFLLPIDEQPPSISVGFSGGQEAGRELLEQLGFESAAQREIELTVQDGRWHLGPPGSREGLAAALSQLGDFSSDRGCVASVGEDVLTTDSPIPGVKSLLISVPTVPKGSDSEIQLWARLTVDGAMPAWLSAPITEVVTGRASRPPSLVVTLGASLLEVLADPAVRRLMKLGEAEVAELDALSAAVRSGSGSTIALFGEQLFSDNADLEMAMAVPVTDKAGRPFRRGQVWKGVRRWSVSRERSAPQRLNNRTIALLDEGLPAFLWVGDGYVTLGEHRDEVEGTRGAPWVGAPHLAAAQEGASVVVSSSTLLPELGLAGAESYAPVLSARGEGDRLDLVLTVHGPNATRVVLAWLGAAIAERAGNRRAPEPEPEMY